jgi:DNA adenine methylase
MPIARKEAAPTVAPARSTPRPFLKWAGGKTQLLPELLKRVPPTFGTYHEPFVGGGALFFNLRPPQARLSDLNRQLIECYQVVQSDVEALIRQLRTWQKRTDKECFYRIRALDPAKLDPIKRAARMIYLNKTCFNGLHRINRRGLFNVPYGRYKKPIVCDAANLRAVSAVLRGVVLAAEPFEAVLDHAKPGDFIYFDPPYQPLSATSSFTSYAQEAFGEAQQRKLAGVFPELSRRGCIVMLSNSETRLIRSLYDEFQMETVFARRAINCNGDSRGKIKEVLVRNYR